MRTTKFVQLQLFVLFVPLLLAGQAPQNAAPQPQASPVKADSSQQQKQAAAVPQTTLLKKTVAFITLDCQDGNEQLQDRGTGFFVAVPDARLGEKAFIYLVTNRHVVEPERDHRKLRVTRQSLRLNLKKQGDGFNSMEGIIPLNVPWYFPKDDAVDLAVLPMAPDSNIFDYQAFPISFFATKDVVASRMIAEGDPVLFCGFFYQYPGQKKIESIVRQGILAMMPDEELRTTLEKPGRIYLADAHVFLGNSGSPMFVNVGGMRNGALQLVGFPYLLLGVVSGYYYETEDLRLEIATTLTGTANANSGISLVVPSDELKALLDLPELQQQRESEVQRELHQGH
ncbi:MAG: serine protease [Terriglobia bacterium]|jgi:hypothetical protein